MSDDKKGMLRHVDVLGRVVIPREVRKALRINYGDLMEFCACSNKQVVMRKFHLIREIVPLASHIVKVARVGNECDIAILDTEKVVCWNGETSSDFGSISNDIRQMIDDRKTKLASDIKLSPRKSMNGECVFQPILCDGDVLGAVVVKSVDIDKSKSLANLIAEFLANYFGE